jgi:RNA polymerase sigma-70 factor, ECF subfamily
VSASPMTGSPATPLVESFLQHSPHETHRLDPGALRARLDQVMTSALARWPGIQIDERALAVELAARWTPETVPADRYEPPRFAEELVLAQACLSGDLAATRYFHSEMFDRVDRVLAKLGVNPSDVDDLKQEVRAKLLVGERGEAKLALYHGTGPLAHWVASVAGRVALSSLRRRKVVEVLGEDDLLDSSDDPQLSTLKAQHHVEFKHAFQDAVIALEPRDRAILRALIVDDRSVNEIAAVYGIHRVTASRWIAEIRHNLLAGTKKRLRQTLGLDALGLESAIRLIDTNMDLSLYRLLADAA